MSPADTLRAALAGLSPATAPAGIGIAVSGGGDSMALLALMADWARESETRLRVATVDHGLRASSAQEAKAVATASAALGAGHDILHWTGWEGRGNLQAEARAARYRLLADWAAARGLHHVCLGHTLDDQAETVLMRLGRGSGVDGLAAMAPAREAHGVTWLRPLLGVPRAELRAELTRRGMAWSEDPANDDLRFDRVRTRQALRDLGPLGLTAEGLSETAERMRAARAVLAEAACTAAERLARVSSAEIALDRSGFFALPDETRWRIMAGALCQVAGAPYRPRLAALKRTLSLLDQGSRTTLHGCLCVAEGDTVRIRREPAAASATATAPGLWDSRWQVRFPEDQGLSVAALGEAGIAERSDWRAAGLPRETLLASPALWHSGVLHTALLLDEAPDCSASPGWGKAEFLASLQSD